MNHGQPSLFNLSSEPQPLRLFVSPSAAERLSRARDVLRACGPGTRVLIIGASRGAADDLARDVAASVPATFGLQRFSLTQFAAKTAIVALAADRVTPSTRLGAEAVATRALFDAGREDSLRYFEPVAATPGFPRALARTLQELRLAGIDHTGLGRLPLAGADLANLLERFDACFERAGAVDRAELFRTAARVLRARTSPPAPRIPDPGSRIPDLVVLLDVPLEHAAERELADALLEVAATAFVTVPHGDHETVAHLMSKGAQID